MEIRNQETCKSEMWKSEIRNQKCKLTGGITELKITEVSVVFLELEFDGQTCLDFRSEIGNERPRASRI